VEKDHEEDRERAQPLDVGAPRHYRVIGARPGSSVPRAGDVLGRRAYAYASLVHVTVRLFAGLRERAGTSSRPLELADGALVADVWPALGFGDEPPGLLFAVNRTYAGREARLADGDEVALIPPVSGGAFRLSEQPLSVQDAIDEVASPDAGAIATFVGTTRRRSRDRDVVRLEYEAYEGMAEAEMERIAGELRAKHDVHEVAIHHRVGVVGIGETSVVIAISAPHRAAALEACREAIDTLKQTVPLWKKEVYEGGEEWIGRGS
jgi:molybdopterin synthase catalytic subunit